MSFASPLFFWQFRQIRLVTVLAAVIALAYTLFEPEPLRYRTLGLPLVFILAHSILLTWRLGRSSHRAFGFLYTQGYSRDALWAHTMLATVAGVLAVWLPSAIVIWSGLRSSLQDLLRNYWFPVMAPVEWSFPLWCLAAYAVFLPTFHYVWIRQAQPTRGPAAGGFLAVGIVLAVFSLWNSIIANRNDEAAWLIIVGLLTTSTALLVGGWRLHRRLEVLA